MNILVKQHEILSVLNSYRKEYEESGRKIDKGLPWNDLADSVNLTSEQLWYVATRLANEKDIEGTDTQSKRGYYITNPQGIASLGTKKYLKERQKNIIDDIKTTAQIIIPVAALMLSILIFIKSTNKTDKLEKEMQSINEQLRDIKQYQDKQQNDAKKVLLNNQNDTLQKIK